MIGELYPGEFETMEHNGRMDALEQEPCEDAISRQYLIDIATKDGAYDYVSAQEIANAPSVRPQEPCTDAISRQEVLDLCDSKDPDYKVIHFKEDVECLPPVNSHLKTGHWISMNTEKQSHTKNGMTIESVKCSECDEWLTASDEYACYGRYCPNCGCRMVEPQESEDKE